MMHGPVKVSRRALLGAAVAAPAAGVLAGCGNDDGEPAPPVGDPALVRVNTGLGLFQGREAYLTVAEQLGFFAEEGIEVQVLPGEGTATNLGQLAAGQVDMATIDVNAGIIEYAEGRHTDFVLCAVLHAQLLGCVMVLEGSGISRPRDLAGTVMGVIPGGTNTVLFPAFAQLHGFDPEAVQFVSPAPDSFPALLAAGEVDAIQQFVLSHGAIEAQTGEPLRLFPYADVIPELYGSALGCSRRMLREQPQLVRRVCRAALRGLEYAVANPGEAGELFAGHDRHNPGQPAPAAAGENELLAPYVRADDGLTLGQFDPDRLVQSVGLLRSYGVIDSPVNVDEFVAYDILG